MLVKMNNKIRNVEETPILLGLANCSIMSQISVQCADVTIQDKVLIKIILYNSSIYQDSLQGHILVKPPNRIRLLGPCPNTCFTHGRRGLLGGMLMTRTQTLIRTHDC